jgi:hypothetical protein
MATTTPIDTTPMTRAQRATLPLSADVAQALAEQHGVCIRPLAMRRIDTPPAASTSCPSPADPPEKTNAGRVQRRLAGCGWPNAARAGTSTRSQSPTGLRLVRTTRS